MDLMKNFKQRSNTRHLEITTLNNSIDELNKNIVKLIKEIKKNRPEKKK